MSGCRVYRGVPVPWVVADGTRGRVELVPSVWMGSDLMTVWVSEGGPPNFAKYDEERARQCIWGRYCHVCGRRPDHLLLCLPNGLSQGIALDGRDYPLVSQPWVCAECLAFSTLHCPPLRERLWSGDGIVMEQAETKLVHTFYRPVDPGDPVSPPGKTVLMAFKLAVLRARVLTLNEWYGGAGRHLRKRLKLVDQGRKGER